MTTKTILITAVCALCGFGTLQAEETASAVAASQAVTQQEIAHPFFQDEPYPAWSRMTAERGLVDVRAALAMARERIAAVSAVRPEEATFENTFLAYSEASYEMGIAYGYLNHLSSVMDSAEMRSAMEELIPELTAFDAEVIANEQLWHVLKSASEQPWVKELSPACQRLVQQTVDGFHDSGADLAPEQKARKAEIEQALAELTLQFEKNVLDSQNAWKLLVLERSMLDGMGEDWMAKAQAEAVRRGLIGEGEQGWCITLDYESYGSVLRDCNSEVTRKKCWEGLCSLGAVGEWDNEPIVEKVMKLRHELAELLGFRNYADLMTHRRMVGGGDNAMAFIDSMAAKVLPAFQEECQQLLAYVSRCEGRNVMFLDPWNRRYYLNKMSRELYQFNPEELRPYHPAERVVAGMFSLYSKLLGVNFTEIPTVCLEPGETCPEGMVEVWHPTVKMIKVTDATTGNHLGSFYMDLYPRPSKQGGAWVMPMRFGVSETPGTPHSPHLAALVGNLTSPVGDTPALFSHYDVETLFHEFGHMMHVMLSDTELREHCGTRVAWDFVELPSQMFENWTWVPEGIAAYSGHYQTGEPMPAELVEKLVRSRYFMPAMDNMGQLCIGKLDLEMHMNYESRFAGRSLDAASAQLLDPWCVPVSITAPSMMRHLTHCISGGYAGGYYSYKWAEVLSADAFTRFRREGVMNTATGASFRESVLRQGDSKPASEVYRDFMGRDPNPDALLQAQGLMPE